MNGKVTNDLPDLGTVFLKLLSPSVNNFYTCLSDSDGWNFTVTVEIHSILKVLSNAIGRKNPFRFTDDISKH